MPLAIEVGLSEFDFWYGDIDLLDIYVDAYNNRVKNTAILNGFYTYIAVNKVVEEALSKQQTRTYFQEIQYLEKMATANKETDTTFNDKVNYWSKFKRNHKNNEEGD